MSGFEDAWPPVAGQVAAMCRAQASGRDADELYQRVMIRAWRGHDGFRGDSAYLTWVRPIVIREARLAAAREAEVRRRVALEPAWTDGPDGAAGSRPASPPRLPRSRGSPAPPRSPGQPAACPGSSTRLPGPGR